MKKFIKNSVNLNFIGVHGQKCTWWRVIQYTFVATALLFWSAPRTLAETPEEAAHEILKEMSVYIAGVKNLSMDFDSDVEVISHGGQSSLSGLKVQISSSGNITISRPGKIRARRTGGYADMELISDGKLLTFHGININSYAQIESKPTLGELFLTIRNLTGMEFPGADLLFSDVYAQLSGPIERAAYIGPSVVDGVQTHHLAFRTPQVDWQIWIESGDKPIPRKYVVTSKWITGAPQFQLRISNWNDSPDLATDVFNFKPVEGAMSVKLEELQGIGDLPLPVAIGGR